MEWLKTIRHSKGLSQIQVATKVQITQPSYSNIENGRRAPSVSVARKIAELLDFDWKHFYESIA